MKKLYFAIIILLQVSNVIGQCPTLIDDDGGDGTVYYLTLDDGMTECANYGADITINGVTYEFAFCDEDFDEVEFTIAAGGTPVIIANDAPITIVNGGTSCEYDGSGGALPVDLISFSAFEKEGKVILDWKTASEENNAGFQIEHSSNARDWKVLDFVEGKGTTDILQQYNYTDTRPLPGDNYYRLKQIDFDSQFEYSDARIVKVGGDENVLLEIFPNPNKGQFTLSLHNPNLQKARIKLFDSTGNMIWEQDFRGSEAVEYWEKQFDLPQREVYFVMTQVGDQVETKKVSVISEK